MKWWWPFGGKVTCEVSTAISCPVQWDHVVTTLDAIRKRLDDGAVRMSGIDASIGMINQTLGNHANILQGHMCREEGRLAEILGGLQNLIVGQNGH